MLKLRTGLVLYRSFQETKHHLYVILLSMNWAASCSSPSLKVVGSLSNLDINMPFSSYPCEGSVLHFLYN